MRFAHMADCHIGAWRDHKMRKLNAEAFQDAVDICAKEKVDFILISGDLFNTAIPDIDQLKKVVKIFSHLKRQDIPVYIIPGSHDFSPSGKTMLDVLEEAGLCSNVVKGKVVEKKLQLAFTVDKKTGAKITGLLGRRGMLERSYYEELDLEHLEKEEGFKIFMFHTSISELKPKALEKMDSSPVSMLPKGFDYYAGGHVHIVESKSIPGYKHIVYPGPLFPNSYHELEELKRGGFYIYEDGALNRVGLEKKRVASFVVDAEGKMPEVVSSELLERLSETGITDALVLIRISGIMEGGKISDINFTHIYDYCNEQSAYVVLRNTAGLSSKEYEEIKISPGHGKDVEGSVIDEHIGQAKMFSREKEKETINSMMKVLSAERKEGEKVYQFEERIKQELFEILDI